MGDDASQTEIEGPRQATPSAELERQIMDPRVPKMERERWASAEITRLRVENIQMRFALGYPMPADLERHILPSNPFKCGMCDARAALEEGRT